MAVLGHVAHFLTRRTLDVGEERTPVPVGMCRTTLVTGIRVSTIISIVVVFTRRLIPLLLRGTTTGAVTKAIIAIIKPGMGAVVMTDFVDARGSLDEVVMAIDTLHSGGDDVAHACLSILVYTIGEAMQMEMRGEIVLIKITIGTDMGLECRNHISKLCVLNRPKEDATAGAVIVVEVHLALESEI
jgi:hypothetical protein